MPQGAIDNNHTYDDLYLIPGVGSTGNDNC